MPPVSQPKKLNNKYYDDRRREEISRRFFLLLFGDCSGISYLTQCSGVVIEGESVIENGNVNDMKL